MITYGKLVALEKPGKLRIFSPTLWPPCQRSVCIGLRGTEELCDANSGTQSPQACSGPSLLWLFTAKYVCMYI